MTIKLIERRFLIVVLLTLLFFGLIHSLSVKSQFISCFHFFYSKIFLIATDVTTLSIPNRGSIKISFNWPISSTYKRAFKSFFTSVISTKQSTREFPYSSSFQPSQRTAKWTTYEATNQTAILPSK